MLQILSAVDILGGGDALELTWSGGQKYRFHAIWLRDNSPDPKTHDPGNGQRLITISDIPTDLKIAISGIDNSGDLSVTFQPENLVVTYEANWLWQHVYDKASAREAGWTNDNIERWDHGLQSMIPCG